MPQQFKITYATMSADNEELQTMMDEAISLIESQWMGDEVPMYINGEKVSADEKFEKHSPINTDLLVCRAQKGTVTHAKQAVSAAAEAFDIWRHTPWQERVAAIRRVADVIEDTTFELSAIMIYEVGKSRLEALGEVAETVDLLRYYADSMEKNNGFIHELGKLNPDDPKERNYSYLRPYGVWVVISPFNFPMALSAAPIAAALVTGNTVVFKGSSDVPYCAWKTAELFAEAGLPQGVFNYVSGPGRTVGQELLDNAAIGGWTFTGSHEIGMKVLRQTTSGAFPRPAIIEMGGKNPTIVSKTADTTKAATGVLRAAFGLDGQKCSACSRCYVQEEVYDDFKTKLVEMTRSVRVGNPTRRDVFMGTVVNQESYDKYQAFAAQARADGSILVGGNTLTEGELDKGYFVEPTIVEGLPENHDLVKNELFVPILHLAKVKTLDEAMAKANDTVYGLTAGFFGEDEQEVQWFLDNIQAGTIYTNRAAGATTGAWPGVQVFGGWKGSGSSGKGIGGLYTLALYMHEQSRTLIG
jgi:1-pyrroline-5-carboxylate dehydrogenase